MAMSKRYASDGRDIIMEIGRDSISAFITLAAFTGGAKVVNRSASSQQNIVPGLKVAL